MRLQARKIAEYVMGVFNQPRALADQVMAATRQRRLDRAGYCINVAPLLGCKPRGDQRTGLRRCLDDERAARQAADDAVAAREIRRQRWRSQRIFADDATEFGDAVRKAMIACRIDDVGAS